MDDAVIKTMQPYYPFSQYLKERFGCRVYKVSIDAGFSCPNRDGTKSSDGCIYCDNRGFSFHTRRPLQPIERQIEQGIDWGRKRFKAEKFFVYFQAYTNTYASLEVLRKRFDSVRDFKDVVGIAIGTRPDCVDEDILSLIESYTGDYEVWLEYGLQSIHNGTLTRINRGHTYEDFLNAVERTRLRKNIKICAHVIIGLPGETKKDVLATARELGRLKLEGIKIHPLHVIKGTKLEEMFREGRYSPLELAEYTAMTAEFLEYLWPRTVIQRLTADCPPEFLAAPQWILNKAEVLKNIERTLIQENRFQGRLCRD
ncbi:MAG: TIGR01212 family radical SAM protein [Candidatus Omnitrophota bacterium]